MSQTASMRSENLDPKMRSLVERYHRNDLPIEEFDRAFLAIVADEAAMEYLEQLEGNPFGWAPTPSSAEAPPSASPTLDFRSPSRPPATNPAAVPAAIPAPAAVVAETAPTPSAVSMDVEPLAPAAPSPPSVIPSLVGCALLLAIVGAVYFMQPSAAEPNRVGAPLLAPGMTAN